MAGTSDIAITQLKQPSGPWKISGVCFNIAVKFAIKKIHFVQRIKPTEIKRVFISDEGIFLCPGSPIKWLGQCNFLGKPVNRWT